MTLGMLFEVAHDRVERSRQVNVIAVEERADIAGGFRESLVDCVDLAAVFFALPVSKTILVTTNHFDAFVSAATVDDHVLERFVSLVQHGQYRLFEKPALVE